MKTKEELNELKIEYESLSRKFAELTEGELAYVTGGAARAELLRENLSPSVLHDALESSMAIIEDSDMAEEATKLAKAQILQQAAQAMLAESNQRMANVFSLLQ